MKDLKISKELLENVLDFKIEKFQVIGTLKVTQIRIWKENNYSDFLNDYCIDIHHFAFKCKEWAFKRGLNLWTDYLGNCQIQDKDFQLLHDCYSDTEIKVIIKASEWVLSEVNK